LQLTNISTSISILLNVSVDGDNIKTQLNEIWREGVDGIQLTQDKILATGFWKNVAINI
jgi:nitrogen regulatory protein PII-like uncharacterized protein